MSWIVCLSADICRSRQPPECQLRGSIELAKQVPLGSISASTSISLTCTVYVREHHTHGTAVQHSPYVTVSTLIWYTYEWRHIGQECCGTHHVCILLMQHRMLQVNEDRIVTICLPIAKPLARDTNECQKPALGLAGCESQR